MIAWRIDKEKYAATADQGIGAYTAGARWNSPRRHVVYTSGSLSLALVEILVHSPSPSERRVPRVFFRIEFPDTAIEEVPLSKLPRPFCPITPEGPCTALGDAWLASLSSPVLCVPSAVVPTEFNYLLNPAHPQYSKTISWWKPVSFHMDSRLCLDPP